MNPWMTENGKEKMIVSSEQTDKAQKALTARLLSIRQSLTLIEVELGRFDALTCPDWADVGDAAHVDGILEEAWEFLAEVD